MFGHQILNAWSFLTWSRSCWKLPSMPQSQTMGAVNVEKSSHCFLQSAVLEANAILSVPWQVFQRSHSSKWLDRIAKDDLLEVLTQSRKPVNTMGKLKKNGK